ncbi:hypothetical protein D3C83_58590 [compost metagenome]
MGAGRAGWYSWDAIDKGGAPSRNRIVPELQSIARGDIMPAVPGAQDALVVDAVDPPWDLVLTVPDSHGNDRDSGLRPLARITSAVHDRPC